MQDFMQPALQPYVRLVQSNMNLLSEFWFSPELMTQSLAGMQRLFNPNAGAPANNTLPFEAFSRLSKGLLENYTRFASDVMSSGVNVWTAAQTKAAQQAQDVVRSAAQVAEPA